MLSKSQLTILIAVTIGSVFFVAGKNVEVKSDPATITVSGEGEVSAVPDIASLSFGVQTGRQETAQAAVEKLSEDMNAIMDAVKETGVEEKDIRTESLRLNPAYDWNEGSRIPRGFEASQSLRVKVRDLDKVGEALSAATNAGANQAGGVSFTIDEPEELQREAREKAIDDAKQKAKELARDLGVSLGELKGFHEGGNAMPMYRGDFAMMEAGIGGGRGAPPMPAGEQEIQVNVSLTYEVR